MARPCNLAKTNEILLEIILIGRWVKVIAIDPNSGREESVRGPNDATSIRYLKKLAVQKLTKQ